MIAQGVLGVLFFLNVLCLVWGLQGGALSEKSISATGLRSEFISIQTPWVPSKPDLSPVEVPSSSKIDLKQGQKQLDQAIETANNQVVQGVPLNQQCWLWGPFVRSEADRIADALKAWDGKVDRVQRQVPVGYVVYLPKARVEGGMGVQKLAEKGVREALYIAEAGPLQGTISLGLFRDLGRATLQKANLEAKGVEGVLIRERLGPMRTFFELKGVPNQSASLKSIYSENPRSALASCPEL